MIMLETVANQVGRQEFSGIGFCHREGDDLVVYDAEILDVGSASFTQVNPTELLRLAKRPDARNGRLWLHRHPIGNGVPGPWNWSGTDENTIQTTPLGGIPEIIQWSAAIVRTPDGWVGRIDNHITKKTAHVEVAGQASQEVYDTANRLYRAYIHSLPSVQRDIDDLADEEQALIDEEHAWYEQDDPQEETLPHQGQIWSEK